MAAENITRFIGIYPRLLTPSAVKLMADNASKLTMEMFTESELLFNITKHFLVPKHTLMSREEKAATLKK
jgi:DNA-directed RNA polymerases I, II, and III subunit RPABC1